MYQYCDDDIHVFDYKKYDKEMSFIIQIGHSSIYDIYKMPSNLRNQNLTQAQIKYDWL